MEEPGEKVGEVPFMGWTFEVRRTEDPNRYRVTPTEECPAPVLKLMEGQLRVIVARLMSSMEATK